MVSPTVTIVDYGAGNIRSVAGALAVVGAVPRVSSNPEAIAEGGALLLPGVGSFAEAMRRLAESGLAEAMEESGSGRLPARDMPGNAASLRLERRRRWMHGLGLVPGRVGEVRTYRMANGYECLTWGSTLSGG